MARIQNQKAKCFGYREAIAFKLKGPLMRGVLLGELSVFRTLMSLSCKYLNDYLAT